MPLLRCFAVLVALVLPAAAQAQPRVVASIPPIHSLVAGVMDGVGAPALLVPATASAHTYALRPSEARLLSEANLVFWIGPVYETFLEKPVGSLASQARIVRLADAPGITVLPARAGGPWEGHAHDGHDHGHAHGAKGKAEPDGHVFLDPMNAKAMVPAIADALAAVDAANAARYRANATAVAARLDALDGELRGIFSPVRARPFILFHDAVQYLEKRYGLNAVGSITVSPERQPGAQRLQRLRRKIDQLGAVCVFAEPQFEPTLVQTVVERTKAKTGVIDYLGAAIAPGPDAYFETMRTMARSLAGCLSG
jgi:zinc transport system substrate-binding protein